MNGRRVALGLLPHYTSLFLLPIGAALGPGGVGLLSDPVLTYVDPAMPIALATLGVIVGMGLDRRGTRGQRARLFADAAIENGLTLLIVGVSIGLIWRTIPPVIPWLLAIAIAICASTSARLSPAAVDDAEGADKPAVSEIRPGGFDNVIPLAVGCLLLAFLRERSLREAAWLTAQAAVVFMMIAVAGWLLIMRAASEREERVFLVGSVLLLGGAAEYLSLSALLAGLIAGLVWGFTHGPTRDRLQETVLHVQHPLAVFVLLVAGARTRLSIVLMTVALAYLLLRVVGKLIGIRVGHWLSRIGEAGDTGIDAIAPGIIGVAFALNVFRSAGSDGAIVLAVTALGSFACELVWLVARRRKVIE